ncbi:MAG: hypothetical protein DWI12_03975 [Planctomycetota bacterium]|nr:MAG: hypothetical protein DWI12_03975 [Planctomycetota bacterium]
MSTFAAEWMSQPRVLADVVANVGSAIMVVLVVLGGLGLLALIIALVIRSARMERERTAALRAFAEQRQCQFYEVHPGIEDILGFFPLFQVGHSRCGFNIAVGAMTLGGIQCETIWGDYQYKITTSNGKQTTTATFLTSFVVTKPRLVANEDLTVRRENWFDKIGEFVGLDDIDFESSEFSKRFHVKCSDRRFAFDLFEPRMMEFFLASNPPSMNLTQNTVLWHHAQTRWTPAELAHNLEWVNRFFLMVPRHLRAARLPADEQHLDPILNPSASETP